MNENPQGTNDSRSMAPLIGFALGAVVGGALALLLAPESGEKTRRRLKDGARSLGRNARRTFAEARDTVGTSASGFGADVKSAIEAGREAFRHDGDAHPSSRIAKVLDPPTPRTP